MSRATISLLLVAIAATAAWSKCASLSVTVEGSVSMPAAGSVVRIDFYPAARLGRSSVDVSPDADGKFAATLRYDRFNGGGLFGSGLFGHDCSRRPQTM